jgi:triosephosphate isomerase
MSVRKPFFGGNWKMNHGPVAARSFATQFTAIYEPRDDRTVVFFPPALSVTALAEALANRPDLRVGVQDVYWEESGAFTGSIAAPMAAEAGALFALAGHSERRHVFGDSDEDVARKVSAISGAGLVPVLCVGERIEERDRGEVTEVVTRQLESGLSRLDDAAAAEAVIAYEPVWAIGTGRTASAGDANEVHELIRALLVERLGQEAGSAVPVIYGGSVKPGNVAELLDAPQIDGALVGGASLKPEDFAAICRAG